MTSKIVSTMFRNVEFWSKWNFILGSWGVLFQINFFVQNLVGSNLAYQIVKVRQDYTRQIGVDKIPGHNTVFFIRDVGEIWVSLPHGLVES